LIEKKLNITHHLQGWGLWFRHHGPVHYWKKDIWKTLCGQRKLDFMNERWKIKFLPKNNNNFPESKKCNTCLKFMEPNGITDY